MPEPSPVVALPEAVGAVEQLRRQPGCGVGVEQRREVVDLERAAGAGGEHQRAPRVLRVLPDEELVRVAVCSGAAAPGSPRCRPRCRRSACCCGSAACTGAPSAPPQFVCRTIRISCERHTRSSREDSCGLPSNGGLHLVHDGRVRRVGDVDDHDAGVVGVAVLAVGPAADVDVVLVDGDRRVHAARRRGRVLAGKLLRLSGLWPTSVNEPGVAAASRCMNVLTPPDVAPICLAGSPSYI